MRVGVRAKTPACRGLRVGPSKVQTNSPKDNSEQLEGTTHTHIRAHTRIFQTLRTKGTLISEPRFSNPCNMQSFPRDTGKRPFSRTNPRKGYFPFITWEKSHVARGRKSGLTNQCAFGPQGKVHPNFAQNFATESLCRTISAQTIVWSVASPYYRHIQSLQKSR